MATAPAQSAARTAPRSTGFCGPYGRVCGNHAGGASPAVGGAMAVATTCRLRSGAVSGELKVARKTAVGGGTTYVAVKRPTEDAGRFDLAGSTPSGSTKEIARPGWRGTTVTVSSVPAATARSSARQWGQRPARLGQLDRKTNGCGSRRSGAEAVGAETRCRQAEGAFSQVDTGFGRSRPRSPGHRRPEPLRDPPQRLLVRVAWRHVGEAGGSGHGERRGRSRAGAQAHLGDRATSGGTASSRPPPSLPRRRSRGDDRQPLEDRHDEVEEVDRGGARARP